MSKKKVLIVCQHFVPFTPAIGGVARVLALVDYLHKNGVEVFVITSDGVDFGYLGYEHIKTKANIIYIHDKFKIAMQKAVRQQYAKSASTQKAIFSRFLKLIKNFIFEFFIPDPGVLVRGDYIDKASTLIVNYDIKNVLVTSPPHSMQLVGLALKKKFSEKINLIVDYRDSWNGRHIFRPKSLLAQKLATRMEKQVLINCDCITYVSEPMMIKAEKIASMSLAPKAHLVMNGFDDSILLTSSNNQQLNSARENLKIQIGHFGIINDEDDSYRDIRKLFKVLSDYPEINNSIEFNFFGQAKLSESHQLPCVTFFDNLPYQQAREKMLEMDYLLIYHATSEDSDEVITGKFFEYVASKKPMICLSPINMEARRLIQKWNMGYVANIDSQEEIRDLFLNLKKPNQQQFYNNCDVSEFSRSKQNQKILELLK